MIDEHVQDSLDLNGGRTYIYESRDLIRTVAESYTFQNELSVYHQKYVIKIINEEFHKYSLDTFKQTLIAQLEELNFIVKYGHFKSYDHHNRGFSIWATSVDNPNAILVSVYQNNRYPEFTEFNINLDVSSKLGSSYIDYKTYNEEILNDLGALIMAFDMPEIENKNLHYNMFMTNWESSYDEAVHRNHVVNLPNQLENLSKNYTSDTFHGLEKLFEVKEDDLSNGRMIIWHGEPGTGKTWALRMLGYYWKDWATLHYILDVSTLFNNPNYLKEIFIESGNNDKWSVVILEDCEEYFRKEAKEAVGSAASRILNITDGFISDISKSIILASTNANIGEFHQAIGRPGRCLQQLEFGKLSTDEANTWLRQHEVDETVNESKTIAELYSIKHSHSPRISLDSSTSTGMYL